MEMIKGTLDVLILKSLSWGSMHGYAVSRWIRQTTDNALQIEEGALYPALYHLEHSGLIESDWGTSDNNRRAKFYRLTRAGRRQLGEREESWQRLVEAMTSVLAATPQQV